MKNMCETPGVPRFLGFLAQAAVSDRGQKRVAGIIGRSQDEAYRAPLGLRGGHPFVPYLGETPYASIQETRRRQTVVPWRSAHSCRLELSRRCVASVPAGSLRPRPRRQKRGSGTCRHVCQQSPSAAIMTATILEFPADRWQRYKTEPCPKHPEGRRWRHGEAVGDGTRYCRAGDIFCRCDHKPACDWELRIHADGSPIRHGDKIPGVPGRYCARRRIAGCDCSAALSKLCAQTKTSRRRQQ